MTSRRVCACGALKTRGARQCRACWAHQPAVEEPPCRICGWPWEPGEGARGLCAACYFYEWRNGRPRPAYLWDGSPVPPCQTCGRPARGRAPSRHGSGPLRGRCPACYMYERRHGRPRPAALWGTAS